MEWWRELFNSHWANIYSYKHKDTRREASGLAKMLGLPQGAEILDLCCGDGRISMSLARMGYRMTGLDLSETLLKKAKDKASRAGLKINWILGDMRRIGVKEQYDAVVNVFTSFGYFEEEGNDLAVLKAAWKALRDRGKLVVDVENVFFISQAAQIYGGQPMYRPIGNAGGWIEEIMDFDPYSQESRLRLKLCLPGSHKVKELSATYRIYSFTEMRRLLTEAGFIIEAVFGDFALSPYELNSQRMIVVSQKSV